MITGWNRRDNPAAIGVSRALGYQGDGSEVADRDGERVLAHRFRITPADVPGSWPVVTVEGVDDDLLGMCGALDPAGHQALPWADTRTHEEPPGDVTL